jgi:glucose/arabinose dehydrogenase
MPRTPPRALALGLALAAALLLSALLPRYLISRAAAAPPGASVDVTVSVPASMRAAPFNTPRTLRVPPNFGVAVYTRIPGARFMAVAPNGDLLVSQPSSGSVKLVRPSAQGDPAVSNFATGLRRPHDIVFHTIGATTYVYIAETHQINRYVYVAGDTQAHDRQVVVANLPDSSTPELGGAYGHELKNIALDGAHKLYVSIASTCNACLEDTVSNPVRGAIYQYNADGTGGRLFARGIRNAEGLAFVPGGNELWVVINNRDNIRNPATGQVETAYVDNHPPEEFTRVRDGGNYGWPFCNPNHETASGYVDMPFDRDMDFNADGHVDCGAMDRITQGIQAHSAPLGLTFMQGTAFAAPYRSGAIAALHGSWNRSTKTGYKLAFFPWDAAANRPDAQVDLVTGWADDASAWGRPVDTAVALDGGLFISDDASGTVYKLTYAAPVAKGGAFLPMVWR